MLRFTSVDGYARAHLGISTRKVWALLKLERNARRATAFARAYGEGALSWVRTLTLLPVIDRDNAAAWIARAETVTVRRLADEVSWVLEARDACGAGVPLDPPPLDGVLVSPVAQLLAREASGQETSPAQAAQIGARPVGARPEDRIALTRDGAPCRAAFEVCDAEVRFTGPASVVAFFREALDAFAPAGEPRW